MSIVLAFAGCMSGNVRAQPSARPRAAQPHLPIFARDPLPVIPRPREIVREPGNFALPASLTIGARGTAARNAAAFLVPELRRYGITTTIDDSAGAAPTIRLAATAGAPQLGEEGYRLDVQASGVAITANTGTGLYYGIQTLQQLLFAPGRNARPIPYLHITDWPEFPWRGVHLDVSRHFFGVAVVERYIDLAARFKLNTFHWHLADDQGWRIEIRAYPRLTSVGGCRVGTQIGGFDSGASDGLRTCGFYSQRQVREVVAYATARHVTVIPEIEGPGHSIEALAAYPFLACAPGPFATLQRWGSTAYSVCPTERAFQFYDGVLREIAALFPAPFIHIGGDEVPYRSWRESAFVSALMQREHLEGYAAVQAYFTRRLEAIAGKYHRRIAGWDEIDAAGVGRDAIVMAWNGDATGVAAAKHGHDVVMTPDPPLYFDAYQGDPRYEPPALPGTLTTLESVYAYDPRPATLPPPLRARIIGAQGNLWTEYVPSAEHLAYMAYPRQLALAELCWTPRARMRWHDFAVRLGPSLLRLENEGVPFRIPEVRYDVHIARGTDVATIALAALVPGATIHYTLDGSVPTSSSPIYAVPLRVPPGATSARVAALAVSAGGRASAPSFLDATTR